MAYRTLALAFCFAAICLQLIHCENWALLVAGSNGYYNYRHQADICHAYHIVKKHGIPPENIVTMMYDDIAHNKENPIQGNIINQPNGPNVYKGLVIDYREEDVSPDVFLAVLSGNKKKVKELTGKSGKVIKSGPDDHVFVNFADHGAPGLLAFPSQVLHARDLMNTVTKMSRSQSYKKMVFYVEACESGSMFYKLLPDNINVYASSAANRSQSSYACYFDKHRQTFLGDVYSVNWMQDSDKENLKRETIQNQFKITRQETNTSQVREFGDMSISKMTVAEFQGSQAVDVEDSLPLYHPTEDAVPAREAVLHILEHQLNEARTPEQRRDAAQKITDLMDRNAQVDVLFRNIVGHLDQEAAIRRRFGNGNGKVLHFDAVENYFALKDERRDISQWACYEHAVDTLTFSCPQLKLTQDYYAMGQLYMLVNLCERGHPKYSIATAIMDASLRSPQLCRSD